jgi:hypothetical protein
MIASGAVLIDRNAARPPCFQVGIGSDSNAWLPVNHNLTPRQLEQELSDSGWTFFFMAGPIRTTTFGFNRDRMSSTALKRVIEGAKQQRCNCVQIDRVEMRSFLTIPYLSLSAYPRHIQKGIRLAALLTS